MKVYRHKDDSGNFRYFSFSNAFISRFGARSHVRRLAGSADGKKSRLYGDCEFYRFTYKGKEFCLNEDWGDSSRYDVLGAVDAGDELEELAQHFERYQFDPIVLLFWGVLSVALAKIVYGVVC